MSNLDELFEITSGRTTLQLANLLTREGQNEVEETIEGAPTLTLTIEDSSREVRKLLTGRVLMSAQDVDWEYSGHSKAGDTLTATFEHRIVAELRRQKNAAKTARGKMTRAQFMKSRVYPVVRRRGGKFICPELAIAQPIGKDKRSKSRKDASRGKGFAKGSKIRGKEGSIDISGAEIALDVAAELKAGPRATLALVLACIVEAPDFKNPSGGDADSAGMLQVRAETARRMGINNMDREEVCRTFLLKGFWGKGGAIALAKKNPGKSAGWVAQQTQGSAHPFRYDEYEKQGRKIIDAYGGGSTGATSRERKKYEFSQGPPGGNRGENAWEMAGRLAEQVGWRRFIVGMDYFYISEADLIRARPQFSITENTGGVNWLDYDRRAGAKVDEFGFTCEAEARAFEPGTVIEVDGEGPMDGRWLVTSIITPFFGTDIQVNMKRGSSLLKELAEPAAEESTRSSSGTGGGRGSSGKMVRPVAGGSVPNGGRFGDARRAGRKHAGLDIAVPVGTTVKAALGGTVDLVGSDPSGYGTYMDVRHANGLKTRYAHLSKTSVSKGKRVDRGQAIAKSGNTGSSSGPHLHFEVHKSGTPQDPTRYI